MSLSFKIEAPSSHPSAARKNRQSSGKFKGDHDSSEDDDAMLVGQPTRRPELITEFDSTRPLKIEGASALLIPAIPNRDFRAIHVARKAKKARKEMYKPEAANSSGIFKAADSSTPVINAEGLDKINSRTISGGLEVKQQPLKSQSTPRPGSPSVEGGGAVTPLEQLTIASPAPLIPDDPEVRPTPTFEEKALRELISQAGGDLETDTPEINAIIMHDSAGFEDSDSDASVDETTQFRRDVSKRPDPSSLEDYERVPVGQFGLAMLKGMGWKEGTSTSKRGRVGLLEAYVPQARPSLLGIGAKPLVMESDMGKSGSGGSKDNGAAPRLERRYVPLLRKVIDHGHPEAQEASTSRRSRSPSRARSPPKLPNHRDTYQLHGGHEHDRDRSLGGRRGDRDYHSRHDRSSRDFVAGEKRRHEPNRSYESRSGSNFVRARELSRTDNWDDDKGRRSRR